jgi:hypothetical protein
MHPPLQIGIVRRVGLVRRRRHAAAYPIVNCVDAGSGGNQLLRITERHRQHGADGGVQPPEAGAEAPAKGAVLMHAGGDRRMRQLEQDGPRPAGHHDHLAIHFPGDAVWPGP